MTEVVRLTLPRGEVALIDVADLPLIDGRRLSSIRGSHTTYVEVTGGGAPRISLQRLIMAPPPGMVVDHINGDGLDNRRANLRICTHAENMRNSAVHFSPRKTSRFKGVMHHPKTGKWQAAIQQNGVRLFLGTFEQEERAARAYDAAAKVLHGRFAKTNATLGLLAA